MTYEIRINEDGTWDLLTDSGTVISEGNSLPMQTPDDIIDAILDDMGVGDPQKRAFKVLFKQDWDITDQR